MTRRMSPRNLHAMRMGRSMGKTINVVLTTLALFFLSSGCSPSDGFTEAGKEEVAHEVKAMLSAYGDAVKKDGLTAEFNFLERSEDYFWVPPGYSSALTYDSTRTIIEANAKMFRSVEYAWDTLRIVPLSRDLATYTGRITAMLTDTSGTLNIFRMLETGLVRRDKSGRWWILSGQSRIMTE